MGFGGVLCYSYIYLNFLKLMTYLLEIWLSFFVFQNEIYIKQSTGRYRNGLILLTLNLFPKSLFLFVFVNWECLQKSPYIWIRHVLRLNSIIKTFLVPNFQSIPGKWEYVISASYPIRILSQILPNVGAWVANTRTQPRTSNPPILSYFIRKLFWAKRRKPKVHTM